MPAVKETDTLRVVAFPEPLMIAINGRKSKGIVAETVRKEGKED